MIHCKRQILGQEAYKSQDLVYYAELLLTVLANNYNAYRSFVLMEDIMHTKMGHQIYTYLITITWTTDTGILPLMYIYELYDRTVFLKSYKSP